MTRLAREIASKVAPVVDGEEISNESDAVKLADRLGYPLILKAAEGAGGRGLRTVKSSQVFHGSEREDTSRVSNIRSCYGGGRSRTTAQYSFR